jgi:hypothetical protein
MNTKAPLRWIGLASLFSLIFVAHSAVAAVPSGVLQTTSSAASLEAAAELTKVEIEDFVYIREQMERRSSSQRALLWAYLVGGEVARIDGQLAVLWTRIDSRTDNHYLMLKNYGKADIVERFTLEYVDGKDMTFPVVEAPAGATESVLITVLNYSGSDAFDLYDDEGNLVAHLSWQDR